MQRFVIREPTRAELRKIIYITNRAFNVPFKADGPKPAYREPLGPFKKKFLDKQIFVLVATVHDKIIGSIRYEFLDDNKTVKFSRLGVLPKWRGLGVAPTLIECVEMIAHEYGRRYVTLEAVVEKKLPPYYRKLGYWTERIEENPFMNWHYAVMKKRIKFSKKLI